MTGKILATLETLPRMRAKNRGALLGPWAKDAIGGVLMIIGGCAWAFLFFVVIPAVLEAL